VAKAGDGPEGFGKDPSETGQSEERQRDERPRRRTPRWAILTAAFGALLMLFSGGALAAYELVRNRVNNALQEGDLFVEDEDDPNYGEDIRGPLNILLAGVDTRPSRPNETPRADAVLIVHINEDLASGYFISFPRDALVEIPAFQEIGYAGGTDRLTHAMYYGANPLPGEQAPDLERGFRLLSETVSNLTGIERFDAGAVLKFQGFEAIVDAIGGITVNLDQEIYSCHMQPDGRHRPANPYGSDCPDGYIGPQAYYPAGRNELEGWQALDVARQRYGIENSDYGRQDNQQKIFKAIMGKALSRGVVTDVGALNELLDAVGDAMIFDGRGNEPIDFAFALQSLRPNAMESITLPGDSVGTGSGYQGEQLRQEAYDLFAALREGQLEQFLLEHPDLAAPE
jgi:anionic cell wall polymer biosynthesis LytR-Cps2A-Psr (LCP) family protein